MKSVTTVVGEILQEAQKMRPNVEGKDVMLRVASGSGEVAEVEPERLPAGARRDSRPAGDREERSAAAPGEVRFGGLDRGGAD